MRLKRNLMDMRLFTFSNALLERCIPRQKKPKCIYHVVPTSHASFHILQKKPRHKRPRLLSVLSSKPRHTRLQQTDPVSKLYRYIPRHKRLKSTKHVVLTSHASFYLLQKAPPQKAKAAVHALLEAPPHKAEANRSCIEVQVTSQHKEFIRRPRSNQEASSQKAECT